MDTVFRSAVRKLPRLVLLLSLAGTVGATESTQVFVELEYFELTVAARYQTGEAFDEALHRASVRLAQDTFLQQLTALGIDYELTSTALQTSASLLDIENRGASARLEGRWR